MNAPLRARLRYRSGERVVINPRKDERYAPAAGDRLIVLAES